MIYADYNGSSPLLPSVKTYLHKRIDSDLFANPNAIHSMGQKISLGIEKCRQIIADVFGCYPDQIFFNSGSSEGVSTILHSVLEFAPKEKNVVITSPIEHAVMPAALSFYEDRRGFIIKKVKVDESGVIDLVDFQKLINEYKSTVALVSIMGANNETGVIQPYQEIAKICRAEGIEYFCDTTTMMGKLDFHFERSQVDYAICSSHKLGALTGSGFLIAREPEKIMPYIFGSSQERSIRGGTQHYLGIETLAIAAKNFDENKNKLESLELARLNFEKEIKASIPEAVIIGENSKRLAGTTLVGFPGIHGQAIQIELESHNIFVTTSAACSDNQPETSKVLQAMGINDQIGRSVIRISLSYSGGKQEYADLAAALKAAYNKLNKIHSY
ncbi:MAG: cysteine desulfurase family protein [Bacteriovoracaceae bacterium]